MDQIQLDKHCLDIFSEDNMDLLEQTKYDVSISPRVELHLLLYINS